MNRNINPKENNKDASENTVKTPKNNLLIDSSDSLLGFLDFLSLEPCNKKKVYVIKKPVALKKKE